MGRMPKRVNVQQESNFANTLKIFNKALELAMDRVYYTTFIIFTLAGLAYYHLSFVYATLCFIAMLMYIGEGYSALYEWVKYKYSRFRSLNSLVSTKYKGIVSILFYSIVILLKAFWYGILNFFDNRLEKLDKHKNVLNFSHNGRIFSILFYNKRLPDDVIQVIDENSIDVTDRVLPFIRFQEQVLRITPELLGYKNLQVITTIHEEPLNFNEKDTIIIK